MNDHLQMVFEYQWVIWDGNVTVSNCNIAPGADPPLLDEVAIFNMNLIRSKDKMDYDIRHL